MRQRDHQTVSAQNIQWRAVSFVSMADLAVMELAAFPPPQQALLHHGVNNCGLPWRWPLGSCSREPSVFTLGQLAVLPHPCQS